MIGVGNKNFPANLPIIDDDNQEKLCIHMRAMFKIYEYVTDGFQPLGDNDIKAQKFPFKEEKKQDQNSLFQIHQCVDAKVFDKISHATTSKEAWDMFEK